MTEPVYVVVESTPVGDSVLGVFSTLERARAVLADVPADRLAAYRVELQVPDAPLDLYSPWQVSIRHDGAVLAAEPIISCAGCDEDATVAAASFIEVGGELMRIAVWARTPGRAIAAAEAQGRRLIEQGLWRTPMALTPVPPVHSEAASEAAVTSSDNQTG